MSTPGDVEYLDIQISRLLEFAKKSKVNEGGFGWLDENGIIDQSKNIQSVLLVCTSSAYHAFYADVIFDTLAKMVADIKQRYDIAFITTHPTFVHYPHGLDMVNLPEHIKNKLIKRYEKTLGTDEIYNYAMKEFLIHLSGDAYASTETFAKIVKLQDQLHNRSCKDILPELAAFVYADE